MAQASKPAKASKPLFQRLLIANRGEIALRVIRTAREMGIQTVAIYSDADRNALHVRRADHAVHVGGSAPSQSYLCAERILQAAQDTGCDALHPGYGFLAENAAFAKACNDAGLVFVGPSPQAITLMGDKVESRIAADAAGLPLVPGLKEDVRDAKILEAKAKEIGYPVMLKAAAGGGGKGIRIVNKPEELHAAADMARAEALSAFADDRVYLEKFVDSPRHVEIQVVADQQGKVVHYGERECSVQRRHQKLVEETPCVVLTPELRQRMGEAACHLSKSVNYLGVGTVEFLYSKGEFYFLEMNTRLQVEHAITEMCYDVDLVREQFRVAAGLPAADPGEPRGHAIEVRVNAEDPETFFPSLGTITRMNLPGGPGVRMDSSLFRGYQVTPHYDSMLAKLVVHAADRDAAIARARRALSEFRVVGVYTTIPVALRVLGTDEFCQGNYDTGILERMQDNTPDEVVELAVLAAALAKYQGTERLEEGAADAEAKSATSTWVMVERMERLGRRPR